MGNFILAHLSTGQSQHCLNLLHRSCNDIMTVLLEKCARHHICNALVSIDEGMISRNPIALACRKSRKWHVCLIQKPVPRARHGRIQQSQVTDAIRTAKFSDLELMEQNGCFKRDSSWSFHKLALLGELFEHFVVLAHHALCNSERLGQIRVIDR